MNVLYISAVSSQALIAKIYHVTGTNPGFAVQKFTRLLLEGMSENNARVSTLSAAPISKSFTKKIFISLPSELEGDILYNYVPMLNIPILKHLVAFLYTIFYILRLSPKNKKETVIVCDVLSVSLTIGALFAAKLSSIRCVAIVTDIFGLMVGAKSTLSRIAAKLNSWYVKKFDKYILLTEQMNERVNPNGKPYIVMEALCDCQIENLQTTVVNKSQPRIVLYAGGIHERYGLKMLAEAFLKANISNAKLVYYGSGPYVKEFSELCKKSKNLEYRGVAPNDVVVAEELAATLLINPRFSNEEFAKYSFPSKNMEFMASGTPLLTTRLPGMPVEYYPYVYMFEEESIEGYSETLRRVLDKSDDELFAKGQEAKRFVLQTKNNIYQGKRIVDFLNS